MVVPVHLRLAPCTPHQPGEDPLCLHHQQTDTFPLHPGTTEDFILSEWRLSIASASYTVPCTHTVPTLCPVPTLCLVPTLCPVTTLFPVPALCPVPTTYPVLMLSPHCELHPVISEEFRNQNPSTHPGTAKCLRDAPAGLARQTHAIAS